MASFPEDVRLLQMGQGRLAEHIDGVVNQARQELQIGPEKEIVPIILLYRYVERDYTVVEI